MATSILNVWGIGSQTAEILSKHNINTAEDLATATEKDLTGIPGFGPARAGRVIKMAKDLLRSLSKSPETPADKLPNDAAGKKGKSGKKSKKDKKKKKKNKEEGKEKKKNGDKKKKKKKKKSAAKKK